MDNPLKEIKKYLLLIYKRRYLFLFVSMIISLSIVFGSYFLPKRYEASSTVFIERNMIDSLMRNITITPSMGDRIRVLRYYMLSRDLIGRTLKELDMDIKVQTPDAFDGLIREFQSKTNINMRGGDLFIVSVRDENPEFARDFINTLVSKYVEENIASKREETYGASRFLNEQVEYFKGKLNDIQDRIVSYRRDRGIYKSVDEATILNEIKAYEQELNIVQGRKKELLATEKSVEAQLEGEYPIISTNLGVMSDGSGGGSAASAVQGNVKLAKLEEQLENLLVVYTENYPGVVKLKAEIASLKNQKPKKVDINEPPPTIREKFGDSVTSDPVYVDLKMKLYSVQSDIQAVEARENDLLAMIEAKETELQNVPEEKKILAEMEREKATYQSIYDQLLTQVSRTEVSKQMEIGDKTTTFRIVDPAVLPRQPISMDRIKVMLMGIFAGFACGFGVAFLLEKLDSSFKDPEAIRALGFPVLAEIPSIPDPEKIRKIRKRDTAVYACAGVYLLVVGGLLAHDVLGFGYVDRFIVDTQLDKLVGKVMHYIN